MDSKKKQVEFENGRASVVVAQYSRVFIGNTHEEVIHPFAFFCKSLSLIPSSSRLFSFGINRMSQLVTGCGTDNVRSSIHLSSHSVIQFTRRKIAVVSRRATKVCRQFP